MKWEEASVCRPRHHSGEAGQGLGLQKMTKSWNFCDISELFFPLSPNCSAVISNNAVKLQKPVACPGKKPWGQLVGWPWGDETDVHTAQEPGQDGLGHQAGLRTGAGDPSLFCYQHPSCT